MDLKLREHVRNTIFLQKIPMLVAGGHFLAKTSKAYVSLPSTFMVFDANGKRKLYPILWYKTTMLWCKFQAHKGRPRHVTKKAQEDNG